ncbi:MAG: cation-transporting P-type ATPase [Spirochaetota bacterium]
MTERVDWKSSPAATVLEEMGADRERGLSPQQAAERRERYGENRLREGRKTTIVERFVGQFRNVLIYILLIAALFEVLPLVPIDWAIVIGLAFVPVVVNETAKVVIRMRASL